MAPPGKLTVGADGKVRGPAKIEYNNPFPCVNGRYGSGAMNGVLMHTMVCDLPLCIRMFNDPARQASAHFGIAQDGLIHQFGPIGKGWIAWHCAAGNDVWYGIEHADGGNPNTPLTSAQVTASAQLVECLSAYAGFPLQVTDSTSGRGYGVHSMGGTAWGGHTCPDLPPRHVRSAQRPAIITLAKQIRAGKAPAPAAPKAAAVARNLVMYDNVTVSLLPPGGDAYACYTDGRYANCPAVRAKFPGAKILTIAVFASDDADCLDVEPGDATVAQVPGWAARQYKRGVTRPCIYTSASTVTAVIAAMNAAGHARPTYRIWSAHYNGSEHICAPGGCGYPQADATQWTSRARGISLDQSLCKPDFFGAPAAPPPAVPELTEDDMPYVSLPQATGQSVVLQWPAGTMKGVALCTDEQGAVTFSYAELHTDSTPSKWYSHDDLVAAPRVIRAFANPDTCTAVRVTFKAGKGASGLHAYPK